MRRRGASPGARRLPLAGVLLVLAAGASAPADTRAADATDAGIAEARALLEQGEWQAAARAARDALSRLDTAGLGDTLDAAELIDITARALTRAVQDRSPELLPLTERAFALRARQQGCLHPDTARSEELLAVVLRARGDARAALALHDEALAVRELTLGPGHREVAASLRGLGLLRYDASDFAGARAYFERALEISERSFGPDHVEVTGLLLNLGIVARQLGDYALARRSYERALTVKTRWYGPGHPDVAATLNSLALLQRDTGDLPAAVRTMERAMAAFERAFGPADTSVAGACNNLGALARLTGDLHAARAYHERALAIRENRVGAEHPEVAQSLVQLALVFGDADDPAAARPLLERALAIRERALGPDHREVAITASNLAEAYSDLGEFRAALELHRRALAIRERVNGPAHPVVAENLEGIAGCLVNLGDATGAGPFARRALTVLEEALGPRHPLIARSALTLARVQARLGERSDALAGALRAEAVSREQLGLVSAHMTEHEALHFAEVREGGLALALTLVAEGAAPEQRRSLWEAVARSRAVVLERTAERLRFARTDEPAAAALLEELLAARTALAGLLVRGVTDEAPERARARLDAARRRSEGAERALADASAGSAGNRPTPELDLDAVAGALPAGGALVSIVRYRPDATPRSARPATAQPAARYLALVLVAGGEDVAVVPLGSAGTIEAMVRGWAFEASRVGPSPGQDPASVVRAYRAAGRALRQAVWDPLRVALASARVVLLVPDGALHAVSWSTLPVGRTEYLLEAGPLLHVLTSERDAVAGRRGRPGEGLLAVGGVAFDARPGPVAADAEGRASASAASVRAALAGCTTRDVPRFEPLPATAREVDELVAAWRANDPSDATRLSGELANEDAFRAACGGRRALHLATHGFVAGEGCRGARGTRGVGGLAPAGEELASAVDAASIGIAGLALAGANHAADAVDGGNDGVLTDQEIAALDLSATEWAVLSACGTGLGRVLPGEGVLGLQRAFREAGVGTVIVSLWDVADEATRAWMAELYRARLDSRFSTAEAVREASRRRLAAARASSGSSHPFTWGAFVATGDWR